VRPEIITAMGGRQAGEERICSANKVCAHAPPASTALWGGRLLLITTVGIIHLRQVEHDPSPMDSLSEQLAAEFLSEYRGSKTYLRDHISRLSELATSENAAAAEPATRALFAALVERLADSFDPEAVSLYNRFFAHLIQICRRDARARSLDRELRSLGLDAEEEIVARAEKLRQVSRLHAPRDGAQDLRLVVVLSRVTLGADVAITSVILGRLKREFPGAEIALLGGKKAAELFGGDPRLRFMEIAYRRTGALIERLLSWTDVLACVRGLTRDLDRRESLIVDPDTRLTQLGLLPVTSPDPAAGQQSRPQLAEQDGSITTARPEYLFFPSREYGSGTSQSLGELTSAWLDDVFGDRATTYPSVCLNQADIETARRLVSRVRSNRSRKIVAINFGVGENPHKRVGGDFEASLVARLLQQGNDLIFDKGAGEDEIRRADAMIAEATRVERDGRSVRAIETGEQNLIGVLNSEHLDADILVWNGRIGMLAALIGESDLYIGYDSAGQHIAAALGVPCIDVFAGYSSPRMLNRWRPTGKASTRVVAVDPANGDDENNLAERVLRLAGELLRGGN
jgi:ADP-heptose:LPS heptosyltransferase